MKRMIITITAISLLFVLSSRSVNAQDCSDPNCPFNTNNVQISGLPHSLILL